LTIIDDILDFSKIEARKLTLDKVAFQPRQCVEHIVASLSEKATERGLKLTQSVDASVHDAVVGDPARLRQILINLVGNAIKFTTSGVISIEVKLAEERGSGVALHFCVADTGVGIAKEKQRLIFEAFTQVDGSSTRKFGGTGLGLTISSQLVALMNGSMWVESEVGKGSRFFFTVTLDAAANAPAAETVTVPVDVPVVQTSSAVTGSAVPSAPAGEGSLRILLTEDNPVNQKLAMRMLQKLGHQVTLANNGREAVQNVQKADWRFDLVFMDVQMPEMDGLEATGEIRRLESSNGRHIPIVALTAHAMTRDRERCLEAGMDGYLTKPIQMDRLAATLQEIAAKKHSEEALTLS
jgi:hypothetical protein